MTNSILGFDPASLAVFAQQEKKTSNFNDDIYRPRPAESKSTDGIYRATIRILYCPYNPVKSIFERQTYGMIDTRGFFQVVSKLTDGDNSCPVFNAWKQCRYSDNPALAAQATTKDKGGNGLFDKRFERYVTVQVMDDQNHPELNGKYMFWKLPKAVYEAITMKMHPSEGSNKTSIPVMDILWGRAVYLEVKPGPDDPSAPERKTRETSYAATEVSDDIMACTNPDGSPLLNADEQAAVDKYVAAMKPVWSSRDPQARAEMLEKVNADPNTEKVGKLYLNVIEKVKEFCPDITEVLGYKEWSQETTERVNNWIAVVLAGKNPATVNAAAVAAAASPASIGNSSTAPATGSTGVDLDTSGTTSGTAVTNDLPF